MATMNKKRGGLVKDTNTTINHEGSGVHSLNSLERLFSKVLGSFFGESTYYEKKSVEKDFAEIQKLVKELPDEDIEYVLKIARIGREYNMIQYPLALLTACFNDDRFKGESFIDENTGRNMLQTYSDYVVRRGKDILDILAMQMNVYGFNVKTKCRGKNKISHRDTPLPMQLRKSLKFKLETFNEYQLSKALGENKEVSMADVVKLLHPNPSKARVSRDFYKKVIEGKVEFGGNEETKQVQSELSKSRNKNSKSTIKDVAKSIDTSTVMAIIKNLVALERAGVLKDKEAVDNICRKLTDANEIKKSRLLPFRFYSAYEEVQRQFGRSAARNRISDALVEALDLSINNLQNIDGYSAILIDLSGSMDYPVSSMSNVTAKVVACILGAICYKKGNADIYCFADRCSEVKGVSRKSTVMDITQKLLSTYVGGCTDLSVALSVIKKSRAKYDNLIILSDNDCYTLQGKSFSFHNSYWGSKYAPDDEVNSLISSGVVKKVFINNLLGNNFAIVNTDDFRKNLITGFSERTIDVINVYSSLGRGASDIRAVIDSIVDTLPTR